MSVSLVTPGQSVPMYAVHMLTEDGGFAGYAVGPNACDREWAIAKRDELRNNTGLSARFRFEVYEYSAVSVVE